MVALRLKHAVLLLLLLAAMAASGMWYVQQEFANAPIPIAETDHSTGGG
ncbi:MAG: hypothetical protein ACE5H9_04525 [Anaerolineae bacterium]